MLNSSFCLFKKLLYGSRLSTASLSTSTSHTTRFPGGQVFAISPSCSGIYISINPCPRSFLTSCLKRSLLSDNFMITFFPSCSNNFFCPSSFFSFSKAFSPLSYIAEAKSLPRNSDFLTLSSMSFSNSSRKNSLLESHANSGLERVFSVSSKVSRIFSRTFLIERPPLLAETRPFHLKFSSWSDSSSKDSLIVTDSNILS